MAVKHFGMFRPERREVRNEKIGGWTVFVQAPAFMGTPEVAVELTEDQFFRYRKWRNGSLMIQDALPELSVDEREKLMTGLDDANFKKAVGADDE